MDGKPEFEIVDVATKKVRETVHSKYMAKNRLRFWTNAKGSDHFVRPKKKEV